MLKGRLGIEDARLPQRSRNGILYIDMARLSIENGGLVILQEEAGQRYDLPYQTLNALLLGPGSAITHDAVRHLATHGVCISWVGRGGVRCYTQPPTFDRDSTLARTQATYWASERTRLMVGRRMYEKRFGEKVVASSTDALRGIEAERIKRSYQLIAKRYNVDWRGRKYDRAHPDRTDEPNMAINHAVTAIEAAATIAVAATGTIPQLGFLHEDSAKSWILDVCDLYRTSVTVPIAFETVSERRKNPHVPLEREIRANVSRYIRRNGLLDIMIDDIKEVLV